MHRRPRLLLIVAALGAALPATADTPRNADVRDDVFYHFMPIAWRDSDNDTYRFGDFDGMTASLDYLDDLGVTAVWMNPIFPSPAYHGYQHGRADQVNPWFGSKTDFLAFVDAAHARGIKVYVDFVVYGISHDSPWYQDAYNTPASPYDDWLAFTNYWNTSYQGYTFNSWNGNFVGFIHWDLRSPDATALVNGWAQDWLDPDGDGDPSDGLDGYRLDHVWYTYPDGPDGWGYNIDWWVQWNAALESVNPDVFIFAEQADWGSTGADLLEAFDAAFTKPFEFAARDALAGEYAAPLYSAMASTLASLPEGKTYMGIIGDHDVTRLASAIGPNLDKGKAAAAVLLTQPFPPIIYYGDELGMLGDKTGCSGDTTDIGMREPFKWNAVAGPPMTNYWALNTCATSNAFSYNNDGRSVEEQLGVPGSLLEEYKTLIAARHENVALRHGSYHEVPATSAAVWAFLRHVDSTQTLLVAINVNGAAQSLTLDLSNVTIPGGATAVIDVVTGDRLTSLNATNQAAYPLYLPAYGYHILAVDVIPDPPQPQVIDGRDIPADLGLGTLVATQDNETGMGDNVSELNQLFVTADSDSLQVGITGNLEQNGTALILFVDSRTGGQNTLDTAGFPPPPGGMPGLDGLTFDTGFAPDFAIYANSPGGTLYVDLYELDAAGGGTKRYIGNGTVNDGDAFLNGGNNPNGMLVALDNTNTAGITDVDVTPAATATTGFEMDLPYADLGLASQSGTIKVLAVLVYGDGELGNQFLPGLGGGFTNLGATPLDLAAYPGRQYATVALDRLPGDWNNNGVLDGDDFAALLSCQTAPDAGALGPGCTLFDFDTDEDVDLVNLAEFQWRYGM